MVYKNKIMNVFLSGFFVAIIIVGTAQAQGDGGSGQITGRTRKAILTAVPFLGIGPDARAASLGESGVATSPDINAVYWNSAKLTFIEGKPFGASLSYAPWLARVINDMSIAYLTAYYQITKEQAVAFSLKYFNLGDIQFTDAQARNIGIGFPTEYAIGVTYSRKLTQNMGVGVSLKYIASNLLTDYRQAGGGGNADAIAFNLSWYYTKELFLGTRPYTYSLGVNISDIGNRISYVDNPAPNQLQYLPANLRIGGAFGTELDPYNSLTLSLDFNKLLVPTPGESGFPEERSYLSSVFGSLADAPGGAREEFQEITILLDWNTTIIMFLLPEQGTFTKILKKEDGNITHLGLG